MFKKHDFHINLFQLFSESLNSFFVQSKMLEGAVFMDYGSDLGSGRLVPGRMSYILKHFASLILVF